MLIVIATRHPPDTSNTYPWEGPGAALIPMISAHNRALASSNHPDKIPLHLRKVNETTQQALVDERYLERFSHIIDEKKHCA